jgi:hypothetical protein
MHSYQPLRCALIGRVWLVQRRDGKITDDEHGLDNMCTDQILLPLGRLRRPAAVPYHNFSIFQALSWRCLAAHHELTLVKQSASDEAMSGMLDRESLPRSGISSANRRETMFVELTDDVRFDLMTDPCVTPNLNATSSD